MHQRYGGATAGLAFRGHWDQRGRTARPGHSGTGSPPVRSSRPKVEEALYTAAVANSLVADDGERQCWPRSGADSAPACRSRST
jgi:hypothetical protein